MDKLFGRQPKFTRADFIPIARFTEGPMVLVVNDQTPYKTLKDMVDDAKKRPNDIVFSSSGLYGALHLPIALFLKSAGLQMRHLPTNGGGPALTAILGNTAGAGHADRRGHRRSGPASFARWAASPRSARRLCPTCRR
jgi:tripartite-type tricarboxylate transporter receptor subunit TctC